MRRPLQSGGRAPAVKQAYRDAQTYTFTAPTAGLVTNRNLSTPPKQAALVCENWIPTSTGLELRPGAALHATIGTDPVEALLTYESGITHKIFAADDSAIYDITAPADPETAPSAAVSSLTSGYWSSVQFEATGGDFLLAVNGADAPREYDGSSWASATLSGSGLTVSDLSQVWVYQKRVFFIEDGTMTFWYLPAGAKAGTLTSFSLAGVFKKGGALLYGATWSLDAGDGPQALMVLVTTKGEVAVYGGTDPASDFSLVGVYKTADPLGKNAWLDVGGDLLMATVEGIVPISQVIAKDPAALSLAAVTRNIEPTWKEAVSQRQTFPWSLVKHDLENLMFVGMPSPGAGVDQRCLVANAETGAWCAFTGVPWDIRAQAVMENIHYAGGAAGKVYRTMTGGNDAGSLYTCRLRGHNDPMRRRGALKSVTLGRATFRGTRAFVPKLSASANYAGEFPAAPSSVADSTEDAWDEGLWDEAIWDGSSEEFVISRWTGIGIEGHMIAPELQVTCGVTPKPDAELMTIDFVYEVGDVVLA